MADFALEIDAAGSNEDGSNPGSALALNSAAGWSVAEFDAPPPELKANWAGSIDTDGALRADANAYQNRTVTVELWQRNSTAALLQTALDQLRLKLGKLDREGGTLKVTVPAGDVRIFDAVAVTHTVHYDPVWAARRLVRVSVTFTAKPFSRGVEIDLGDNVETTLPWLVFTDTGVGGDVPALGRLVIDNDDATNDQWWLTWGVQSKYYDAAASAGLTFQAETLTATGGSAIAAGPTGASGAGSNVMRNTALPAAYQAILSTQATGAGAHLSHIGTFRVWTRVQVPTTNTGTVSIALEWGEGDFRRFTQNTTTSIDPGLEGTWQLIDLGFVTLTQAVAGTQRWEGRILAKSTIAGDDLDIDWLMLIPVDEGSGEVSSVLRVTTPTAFSARDEFDQTVGALTGKTLPIGGTWVGAGDADDFQVSGSGTVTRVAVADVGTETGRYATALTPTLTGTFATIDATISNVLVSTMNFGLVVRYTDINNWFMMRIALSSVRIDMVKMVAGAKTIPTQVGLPFPLYTAISNGTPVALTLLVDAGGRYIGWINERGQSLGSPLVAGTDSSLATGGALASGKVGIYDVLTGAGPCTRTYDNFAAWIPVTDAAMFASQSLEIRHDRVIREDSGGTLWQPPSSYIGDYLRLPPAGAEGRILRVIVKASRNVPGQGLSDTGTDDISARLLMTPRYLT